jgi:hypothetical protein
MIHAVRMRERDARKAFHMATYVSAATGTRYTAGSAAVPATIHVVENAAELAELGEIPQFQILTLPDEEALKAMIQREMEDRARGGLPAIHAYVERGHTAPPPAAEPEPAPGLPRRSLGEVLRNKAANAEPEGPAAPPPVAQGRPPAPPPPAAAPAPDHKAKGAGGRKGAGAR